MANLQKDLKKLINAGIIDASTADNISAYYSAKGSKSINKLFLIFGILGALFIGFGVVMIIAFNWSAFPKFVKLTLAFAPLLICQLLAAKVIFQQKSSIITGSTAWSESVGILLCFSIAICMSLIAQIYQIGGSLGGFFKTWAILSLPIIYLLPSSVVSLLYIASISFLNRFFVAELGASSFPYLNFLFLLILVLPYYVYLCKSRKDSNFTLWHHWIIVFTLFNFFARTLIGFEMSNVWYILVLAASFYAIGRLPYFEDTTLRRNPYLFLGGLATLIIFYTASFLPYWKEMKHQAIFSFSETQFFDGLFLVLTIALAVVYFKLKKWKDKNPLDLAIFIGLPLFLFGKAFPAVTTLIFNICLLLFSLYYLLKGHRELRLSYINIGLIIFSLIILTRFMEYSFGFIARGVAFILIGVLFFFANSVIYKRNK